MEAANTVTIRLAYIFVIVLRIWLEISGLQSKREMTHITEKRKHFSSSGEISPTPHVKILKYHFSCGALCSEHYNRYLLNSELNFIKCRIKFHTWIALNITLTLFLRILSQRSYIFDRMKVHLSIFTKAWPSKLTVWISFRRICLMEEQLQF